MQTHDTPHRQTDRQIDLKQERETAPPKDMRVAAGTVPFQRAGTPSFLAIKAMVSKVPNLTPEAACRRVLTTIKGILAGVATNPMTVPQTKSTPNDSMAVCLFHV